jgi:integrase
MSNALRPSELSALRWKCFDPADSSLNLAEMVYKGKIREWGKTRTSLAKFHISALMAADLLAWKAKYPDSSPEAYIFSNKDRSLIDTDNYRKRVLHELAENLNLPKLTFQLIRRAIATLSQHKVP